MNVLHLPYNIANFAPINVKALNEIEGVKAKGIIFQPPNKYHSNDNLLFFPGGTPLLTIKNFFILLYYIRWADVVHWYWDDKILPMNLTLFLVKIFRKKCFIEWLGEEVRIPEIEAENNGVYSEFLKSKPENFQKNRASKSLNLQKHFSAFGFYPIVCPEIATFLKKDLFGKIFILRQRIDCSAFLIKGNRISFQSKYLKITHCPSRLDIKGTAFVEKAINNLKSKGYNFQFDLVHNQTNKESMAKIAEADIFLDQFILGGYGMATLEALSMGVPTICYISEYNRNLYPKDLPIINSTGEYLEATLEKVLKGEIDLKKISEKSKTYVQKYHDSKKLVHDLIDIYNAV